MTFMDKTGGCTHGWRNRGGGDREGPSPPGLIDSIFLRGPGDPIYNENRPFLLLLSCYSTIAIVCIGGFGPVETLGALFLEVPRGLIPSPLESFLQPWLYNFFPANLGEVHEFRKQCRQFQRCGSSAVVRV